MVYRLYAELQEPQDKLISVFAHSECAPVNITTTGDFHNDVSFGGVTAAGINPLCATSSATTVDVAALPDAAFAQDPDDQTILVASEGVAYQWYLNGEAIDGANDRNLTIEEDGTYSVEVTDANGCSAISDELFVMITLIEGMKPEDIRVFPTPVPSGQPLYLIGVEAGKGIMLRMLDASGKEVWNSPFIVNQIPTSGLSSGIYSLEISDGNQRVTKRLMVK